MDFKDYLLTQKEFSLSALAFRMWPNNKRADNYLSAKLNGLADREFTAKDEKLARKALKELGVKLIADSKAKP
jgi:hypothetical protein